MTEELERATNLLCPPGTVVEVRCIGENFMASGYFNDPHLLAEKVGILDHNPELSGIYVTLNKVNPALLARRTNRIKMRLGKKDATTADGDIIARRWLPIDIDPVRPSGISSSDAEHAAALEKADAIAAYLADMGWPEPVRADSGNGAHLLYRVDLPNDEESRDLVKGCLDSLHIWFSDTTCQVDTANFNAARIWKLYGTLSRKGDNTTDRPHRRAKILTAPESPEPVSVELLQALATLFPKEPEKPRKRGETEIVLADWLSQHGIGYTEKPYADGRLFILDECPFSGDHKDGAYAIQFASGGIFAGCHHNTCGPRKQRWPELKEIYEGRDFGNAGSRTKAHTRRERKRNILDDARTAPIPEIPDGAGQILREGEPLTFMLDTFARDHEGDEVVAECLILSLASRSVINSKGLHVSITGESGKGKSHAIDTMLQQVPPELRLDGRMSDKALFYAEGLQPASVIALDDVSLSDQMQEILKGVTTSFQKDFVYRTVSKDRTGQILTIPERCVWWVAKVEGIGDDQVFNRMLTCWIDDSVEQDARVLSRILDDAAAIPEGKSGVIDEVLISREIWRSLSPVHVVIPYSHRIRFQSAENRRNPDMLLDLIRSYAALRQYQRDGGEIDGMRYILATEEDFKDAAHLYSLLNGVTGGQVTKLTQTEAALITIIRDLKQSEVTVPEMQRKTKWASSKISKLINGYFSRGQNYSGLLEKCPAISYLDRTVSNTADGLTVQRRQKVYLWDETLYTSWAHGGAVWLERDTHGYDDDDDCRKFSADGTSFSAPAETNPPDIHEGNKDLIDYNSNNNVVSAKGDHAGGCECRSDSPDECVSVKNFAETAENKIGNPQHGQESGNGGREHERIAAESLQKMRRSAENQVDISDPADFIRIEGLDSRRCSLCGRWPVLYQERFTQKRAKEKGRGNYLLCHSCYEGLKRKKAGTFRTLPGVIDPSGMGLVQASIGKCQVCHTREATWARTGINNLALCDICYQREMQEGALS